MNEEVSLAIVKAGVEWQTSGRNVALFLFVLSLAWLAHYFLYKVIRLFTKRRGSFLSDTIVRYTSRAARLLFLLLAASTILPDLAFPSWLTVSLLHILEISYIVALAWLAIGLVEVLNALINHRLPENIQDDVRARRTRTQMQFLRQIMLGIIWFSAFAVILMTFPTIRNIGAGLFASAGLAGLAVGMAARPTLGNLIAGIQIALTEHIRIDDAVVVEGEWGRVAEVSTTYVVLRLWDLRHMIVPLSYFIEKPFQNWTRYSSELIGAVLLYTDYTVPVEQLREEYGRILKCSPLWDGKTMTVQVTDMKEHTMELRFLMSAANPPATFDLRCYVREKLIEYLQEHHPQALPRVRAVVSSEQSCLGR
jgi:small-conductance mechanosensitive channel